MILSEDADFVVSVLELLEKRGELFPTVERLSDVTELAEPRIQTALEELEAMGKVKGPKGYGSNFRKAKLI